MDKKFDKIRQVKKIFKKLLYLAKNLF